jgi:hypothetical protein
MELSMRDAPLTLGFLWERRENNGDLRALTGKLGSTRIIIKPIDGAPAGSPQWSLQLAETDNTITPEQMRWQQRRGGNVA